MCLLHFTFFNVAVQVPTYSILCVSLCSDKGLQPFNQGISLITCSMSWQLNMLRTFSLFNCDVVSRFHKSLDVFMLLQEPLTGQSFLKTFSIQSTHLVQSGLHLCVDLLISGTVHIGRSLEQIFFRRFCFFMFSAPSVQTARTALIFSPSPIKLSANHSRDNTRR